MKKLLLIIALLVCGIAIAKAQIVYTPHRTGQSQSSNQSQPESQVIRATAYYADSYSGNIYKVPIRIQQRANEYGNIAYYVIEYYIDSGYGGRWQRLTYPAQISRCNSAFASNSLEKQFMYKASFNTQTYYFDI